MTMSLVHLSSPNWTQALTLIDSKIDFYGEWLATGTRPTIDPLARSGAGRAASAPRTRRGRQR